MWVFHVDIYVHMGVKKFFILQKRFFAEISLTLWDFFYTIKMLFSAIREYEIKMKLPLYKRSREGGAFS